MTRPHLLRTNGRVQPLGMGDPRPEFAWLLGNDTTQNGYEVEVATSYDFAAGTSVWRSG